MTHAFSTRTISFNCFKIQDSLSHIPGSLAALVENLKASNHDWSLLWQSKLLQGANADEKLKVALRKGIFPYDFASSVKLLKETHGIPPRECFANKITGQSDISEDDHQFCWHVYELFSCNSLYEYLQIYNHIGERTFNS